MMKILYMDIMKVVLTPPSPPSPFVGGVKSPDYEGSTQQTVSLYPLIDWYPRATIFIALSFS